MSLSHRLVIEGNDELALLGKEFNETIDQAERSLLQQNQFVSDASHELKTPLAIIKRKFRYDWSGGEKMILLFLAIHLMSLVMKLSD